MAENQNIEYKESWRTEYLKWVCGFANAQGGTIYIGVDDKGRPVGLQNAKKLMDDIPNQISHALGIEKMCEACKENGNPLPQFELSNNDFTIVFFANNVHSESESKSQSSKTIENDIVENIAENIVENIAEKLPATQAQIVRLMAKKPSISAKEIAEDLSIAPRNIQVHIKKLQEQGLIKRVGPDKGGHWEVIGK